MLYTNKYVLIGAGVAALVAVYMAKKAVAAVPELAKDALHAIDPFNNQNIINQGAEGLYQWATGSKGTIGGDIYDATHDGALDITSPNNVINQGAEGLYQWATGSNGTIGGDIYDLFH
jgi:hypothetical protein